MKLSIIIPLYNSEKYVSECLDSLVIQNLSKNEFEIVVINDGSKDNSLQLVETYVEKHSNIIVYSQENKGVAAARNLGIEKSNGEYLFFVDSDDYIAANTLKVLIDNLVDNIDLLAFKSIQTIDTSLHQTSTNIDLLPDKKIIDGIGFIAEYGFNDAIGWFIVKKEFLINLNLFYLENRMLEDISFNIDLLSQVKKVIFIPIDVYRYVSRQNSIMTRRNGNHFK
jgi:glycosyltransferase involved in cell wall biosynthesis